MGFWRNSDAQKMMKITKMYRFQAAFEKFIISVGKPQTCKTFGDFANAFVNRDISVSAASDRVGVVFDRYRDNSIKASTRRRRTKTVKPIRHVIESRDVPLPFAI